jgi:hypothetical protein
MIDTALQIKYLHNELRKHYREKSELSLMLLGCPNKTLFALMDRHRPNLLNQLLTFVINEPTNRTL